MTNGFVSFKKIFMFRKFSIFFRDSLKFFDKIFQIFRLCQTRNRCSIHFYDRQKCSESKTNEKIVHSSIFLRDSEINDQFVCWNSNIFKAAKADKLAKNYLVEESINGPLSTEGSLHCVFSSEKEFSISHRNVGKSAGHQLHSQPKVFFDI